MFEAFARATLRGNHSILLLLDDVQWCDHETLACLHYLLRFDPRAPLLLVGTARSEEMTSGHPLVSFLMSLRRDGLVTEVPLNPLTATETAHLAARLARQDLDAAVIAALYQETEGNPLFVVETVRAGVVEKVRTGELSYEDPSARPGTLLPSTVQAVIASRLAQLSPGAHELMSLAAIIGRAFTFDVLAQSSSLNEDRLVQALDELWQRRIVREQGGDAYDFSHEKLREQAYLSLSTARRRLLHRRVGDTLVALNTNNASALDTVSGQIATHYEQASAAEPAIVYYTRAAEVAGRIYANAEALTAFKRALELLRQMIPTEEKGEWKREMSAQCYERMGDILALTGEAQAARDAYHNALVQVPLQDHIRQAGIQRKTAKTVGTQQRYEEALHIYITAETVLGEEPHVSSLEWWQEWIEIQDGKMNVYSSLSRLNEMTELLEKVRPIVQQCGTPTQCAEFFYSSSLIAAERNHYAVTAEMLTEAQAGLAAYEALGNLVNMGWGHSIIGLYHLLQDSLTEAERQYQEGLTMGKRTGDTMLQLRCLGYLALVCRKRGQMEDVQHYISQATTMHPQLRDNIGLNKANLAWIAWREGKMSEARELSRTALREWQLLPTIYPFQWTALLPLIDIALAGKQSAEAVDYVRVLLAPEQLRLPDTLSDILEAAIGRWDDNQPDAAQTYLQQAIVLAQKIRYL
jgi:tetratricopeptide (TPR) repeat protein